MYCVSLAVLDQTKRLFGILLSKNLIFLFKIIFFKQKKNQIYGLCIFFSSSAIELIHEKIVRNNKYRVQLL